MRKKTNLKSWMVTTIILFSLAAYADTITKWGNTVFENGDFAENDFVAIAGGASHSLALKADGSIVGWGSDWFDQATPPDGNDFVAIAAGWDHSLALKADGSIVGWGADWIGQASPPAGDYVAIAAGSIHGLALKADGSIVGWGADDEGQATPPAGDYVAIAAGDMHSLALKSDGSVVGWGDDWSGQASPPTGDFVAIAAGNAFSLGLKADGSIVGWGYDDYGKASPPAGNDFVAIAAGGSHSLALKADGSIVGWGADDNGQATPPAGNNFVAIAAYNQYSLALKADGSIVRWGWGDNGLLSAIGNDFIAIATSSSDDHHSLALKADGSIVGWGWDNHGQASPPAGDYVAIAAGGYHSLALKTDGSIVGWGDDWYGQATPPAGNDFVAIAATRYHNLALKTDGSIVGWGYDLGTGAATPPAGNDYVAIATGNGHSLALKADGSIVGWGNDNHGKASPPAGNDFVAIAAGAEHSLGLKADGSIVGWGWDILGQVSPPAGNDFVAIAAGSYYGLALKADGSIVGWGEDNHGQSSPPAGNDFVAIAAGNLHSLALRSFDTTGVSTPEGTDVEVEPVDPNTGASATLTFDNVTEPGLSWLTISEPNQSQIPPQGFKVGDPPTIFDISTSSVFEGNIIVEINYSNISFENESSLKLFHFEDGEWVDVTTFVDTVNDIIYGEVSSLSDFALFIPNQSPVAVSKDITIYPDYACSADVQAQDVNDGSYDPDGDPIAFTLDPAGPYAIGTHQVTLIVTDGTDTDQADANITVLTPQCTYDGPTLLSTQGQPTVGANIIATLRDSTGNVLDISDLEVTCHLEAQGVEPIEITVLSINGIVQSIVELEPAIYKIDIYFTCDTSSEPAASAYIVIYNPQGGFATGGGWIVPQEDGLNTYPNQRANFGFNAKYKNGDPTGHIEFRYSDGYIDLKSDSIEQLVITGGKIAQFKGYATVNGQVGNWFFAKAIDNGEPGTEDTFEIKIWQSVQDIEGDPTERAGGTLKGGNIIIHTKDK